MDIADQKGLAAGSGCLEHAYYPALPEPPERIRCCILERGELE